MRSALFAVAALLAVAGCTGPGAAVDPPSSPARGSDVSSSASPSSAASAIRIVDEDVADLHLWVSNQSFEDDPVVLTVSIDGTQVVAQAFEVESQHNWILFPIELPPGRHVVTVVSETGAELRRYFTSPGTGRQYASIDYWNDAGGRGRYVSWLIQSTPIGFA